MEAHSLRSRAWQVIKIRAATSAGIVYLTSFAFAISSIWISLSPGIQVGHILTSLREALPVISKCCCLSPDYYDGVVSHPESDILEYEVKWALGSTAVNKASGCSGIPIELFRTKRMMPSRCCIQYVSKSGRPVSGYRTWKGQSSSQFLRRVVLKNVLTIGQLHSSPW